MEKRIRRFFLLLLGLGFLTLWGAAPVQAEGEAAISQVDVYLPDIYVYQSGIDNKEDIAADIKGADMTLTVKSAEEFENTGRGIFYHVLLDTSRSVSEDQLEDMKESVISLSDHLREGDRLEVITFAGKIKVVLEGGESSKKVKETLKKVGRERKTHLYEGINKLSDQVADRKDQAMKDGDTDSIRHVGIILTDWAEVKEAGGLTSQEEALKKLQRTGTPLYGFCLKTAKVSLQDDMGVFLRKTGGTFAVFDQDKKKTLLTGLHDQLMSESALTVHSSSNREYEEEKVLELSAGDQVLKREHVYLNRARPDDEKPVITEVRQDEKDNRTLYVSFSEDVRGADNKSNYSIRKNEKQNFTVSEATYIAKDEVYEAKLILNDPLEKGSYEVSLYNVTDNTNEQNELTEAWTGKLDGDGALKAFYRKLGRFWALLLALAVLLILLAIYLYIKKHRGIMVVEDEMVLGSNMEKKQHVKNDDRSTMNVVFLVSGIASEIREMPVQINGSAIIGRASMCDVYFDDLSMSRQHFALEVDNGELYVTDLDSTGGTAVDDVIIMTKTKLHNGSVIKAGSVSLKVRW